MLDDNLKAQLKAYLERITRPVELVATLDERPASQELRELLQDIRALSDKITVVEKNDLPVRKPSFLITQPGASTGPRFAGVPLGHEFTSLVLALLHTGGYPRRPTQTCSSRSASSRATTSSKPTTPSPATTAPTWCRRSTS
jgi:Alkyl hydroperoxide reductase, large subunit